MSTIHGILGRPYVSLEDHLDLGALDAVHEEVCLGLTRVPVDYTGGSHRAMGIMPPSRTGEALVDYGEVIRAMSRDELVRFRDLAEDPGSIDLDQPGAVQADRQLLLFGLAARHHDDDGVAESGADQGETDAGVPGRALDDRAAGAQGAGRFGFEDQAARGAVLHRASGVEKLCLAEDLTAGRLRRRAQPDHRRGADQGEDIRRDRHRAAAPEELSRF